MGILNFAKDYLKPLNAGISFLKSPVFKKKAKDEINRVVLNPATYLGTSVERAFSPVKNTLKTSLSRPKIISDFSRVQANIKGNPSYNNMVTNLDIATPLAKPIIQAVPRAGANVVISPQRELFSATKGKYGNPEAGFTPSTGFEKLLFGKEPLTGIRGYGEETVKGLSGSEKLARNIGPFVGLGLTALDVTPFGGVEKGVAKELGRNLTEDMVKSLAEKHGDDAVKALLEGKGAKNVLEDAANLLKGANEVTKTLVQKIISALKEAKPLEGKQAEIYSKIRSKRAGAIAGVGKNVSGEKGYFAQLSKLKGEMPKVEFESLRKTITQSDVDSLFDTVEKSALTPFEKISAKSGLAKLLGAEGGSVPVQSELQLLNEVFPPEFVQAVLDKRPMMQKLFSLGTEALNLPRAVMATADLSAPLRQGAFLIGRPKQWIPAFKNMFKYFTSEKAYQGLIENIKARPTYQLMRESRLALTDTSPILQGREEAFMSNLVEKVPGFGKLAKGSNRAYSGFLNKLRADVFDDLYRKAVDLGIAKESPNVVNDIAKFVNSATGRGDLGSFNKAAPVLNGLFFSPRLMASRLNLLNPVYYAKLDPLVRKEAIKSLFTFAGTGLTVLGLAKLAGAEVSNDPRSADFGKIKIGDTRYDLWAGFQQPIVLASRLLTGQMVSSTTGREFNLNEGYKPTTRLDILQRFFESKESPVASFVTSLLKGETSMGEKFNLPSEVLNRLIPIMAQDIYDLYRQDGPDGIFKAIPSMFGVGTQTYTDQIPMLGKTPSGKANVQWRQQPSLGEAIVNKLTGNSISTIPEEQWPSLIEERNKDTIRKIEIDKAKKTVLSTGQPQTVGDTYIYLKNGIVTTKKLTKPTNIAGETSIDGFIREMNKMTLDEQNAYVKSLLEAKIITPDVLKQLKDAKQRGIIK